jgi:hypothetical protein
VIDQEEFDWKEMLPVLHCCECGAQRRQSGVGHQLGDVPTPGVRRIDEKVAAIGNKPIFSLSDAGEPLFLCRNTAGTAYQVGSCRRRISP